MLFATGALAQETQKAAAKAAPVAHKLNKQPVVSRNSDTQEQVIVTGTRAAHVKARQSISPITLISAATLARSGELNVSNALTRTYPSISMSARGSNTNSLVASIQMRGLNPNETLVLVDGKRRHTTANIVQKSGPQFASSGVDMNMIPGNMIDHIEVLEDGAAAMYGSDAIAGVVNIITKKKDHGFNLAAQTGANAYNGDGWQYQLDADGGLKLGTDGYVHLGAQLYHTDHMIAWGPDHALLGYWPDGADTSKYFVKPGVNQSWKGRKTDYVSSPEETRENFGIDFAKPLTEGVELYGQSTLAYRHAEMQAYKSPYVVPGYFPDGMRSITADDELDYSASLGLRGHNLFGFDWDLSSVYGGDHSRISISNVVNFGMIAAKGYSPTKFWDYTQKNAQWTNNLDLRRAFTIGSFLPVNLAMGGEHRLDSYQIVSGNPESYLYGGPVEHVGMPPQSAGKWFRDVYSAYIDTTLHPTQKLQVDLAGRYEYYTNTQSTENGKVSARYDVTSRFALRGTISNGFRAPTLQEAHFSRLNTFAGSGSVAGQLPVESAAARSLGAVGLKPERSTNASFGFTAEPLQGLHVEADAYQINLRDRIVQGGTVKGASALRAISSFGFDVSPTASNILNSSAYYLSNGASTRTQGMDLKADYLVRMHDYGNLSLTAALNLNRTRLHHNGLSSMGKQLLNDQGIAYLTTATPRSKLILNALWTVGKWDVNLRQSRYGETTSMMTFQDWTPTWATCSKNGQQLRYSNACFAQFKNTPRWLTDLEIGYRVTPSIHASVGANNIFNVRPRKLPGELTQAGNTMYDQFSGQVPFTGAYYFGRVNASF
ncbi:TonB-dependent receptor plug domain-containing protein [Neokomagataea anthophila]|uniref:TonB-dependent receptor n=1 Tax=Neokomagataea anthophila TaxID=2826925 RepID=A0ABS5E8Q2_9PROT|nr:TonB-dependent receptor [Neokomagataea anthophila]MBR0560282.1 TonB-dependent receptor [Neokomagataea anthophila]